MVQRGLIVIGPAGSGKSTFCATMVEQCASMNRKMRVINLDPAAESFPYEVDLDIRDLISLDDVVEVLDYGPNGGLIYCMEFLTQNLDWLRNNLAEFGDEEYFIFDCPGQIEFFTHFTMLNVIVRFLESLNMRMCCIYLMDALFIDEPNKFISGCLIGMSAMLQLSLPHINVLSKCDLLPPSQYEKYLIPDNNILYDKVASITNQRLKKLSDELLNLLSEFGLMSFVPLNIKDDDTIESVLLQADMCTQFDEDQEVVVRDDVDDD